MGCLSTRLPDLGIVCIGMVLLARMSTSLTAITAPLVASIDVYIITGGMLFSVVILVLLYLSLPCKSACFL